MPQICSSKVGPIDFSEEKNMENGDRKKKGKKMVNRAWGLISYSVDVGSLFSYKVTAKNRKLIAFYNIYTKKVNYNKLEL